MALWTPPALMGRYSESNQTAPSSTPGASVTAHATAGTKTTTPVQLIASTARETHWILVEAFGNNASATITNVIGDIMIGAGGSESVLIPDLIVGSQPSVTTDFACNRYLFPLRIPASSRLSVRTASGPAGSIVTRWVIRLWGKNPETPDWSGSRVTAYGISSPARGVSVTPGVSAAEGSWTQIVASTSDLHKYLLAGVGMPQTTTVANQFYHLDVGWGAATEVALAQDIPFMTDTGERLHGFLALPIFAGLPSGERLVARLSQHAATAQACDVALYGVS